MAARKVAQVTIKPKAPKPRKINVAAGRVGKKDPARVKKFPTAQRARDNNGRFKKA